MADSVVFSAETGQFVSAVDGMDKAIAKAADRVAAAKNAILSWGQSSIAAAKEAGASSEQLASIQERTAQRLASVTEQNATRQINALERLSAKQKAVAAEMANLSKVVDISSGEGFASEYSEQQKSSAVLRVLSGRSALRTGESFASAIPGFAALSEVAFPIAGAIAFTSVIGEGVEKLKAMYDTAEKVPSALAQGFEAINQPLVGMADNIRSDNDALENTIAKLEHKPQNGVAIALDDARKNADKLADSAAHATDEVVKLLNANNVSALNSLFTGQAETNPIASELKRRFSDIAAAANEDTKKFHYDTSALATPEQQKNAIAEHNKRLDAIEKQRQDFQAYIRRTRTELNAPADYEYTDPTTGALVQTRKGQLFNPKQQANNQLLNGSEDILDRQSEIASGLRLQPTLAGKAKQLESAKQAAEDAKKAASQALENIKDKFESIKGDLGAIAPESALAFWQSYTSSSDSKIATYATEQAGKYAAEFEKGLKEHNSIVTEWLRQQKEVSHLTLPRLGTLFSTPESENQLTAARNRNTMERTLNEAAQQRGGVEDDASIERTRIQLALSQGQLSKAAADKQLGALTSSTDAQLAVASANEHAARLKEIQQQMEQLKKSSPTYNSLSDSFADDKDQTQYLNLITQLAKEQSAASVDAAKSAAKQITDAMTEAATNAANTWQGALSGAMDTWAQHATDTASQVKELFGQTMNGLNNNLVNLMAGGYRRGDFRKFGYSTLKSGAGDLLQQAEGHLLGAGKLGSSASNPMFVSVVNGGAKGAVASGVSGALNGSAPVSGGGKRGGVMGAVESLFHPGGVTGGNGYTQGSQSSVPGFQTRSPWETVLSYVGQAVGIAGAAKFGMHTPGSGGPAMGLSDDFSSSTIDPVATPSYNFGGGRAIGGGVNANTDYLVGEEGPEILRMGSTPGSITPNNKLSSGGDTYYTVHVADGVTPEQFDMKLNSALKQYHENVMPAGAVKAVSDDTRRRPKR